MDYDLTHHARKVLAERGIEAAWMRRTLDDPQWAEPDPGDPAVERRFRAIPGFGGRVLRVAVNVAAHPPRVVSVFFDRNATPPEAPPEALPEDSHEDSR